MIISQSKKSYPADQAHQRDSYWVEKTKLNFAMALNKARKKIGMSSVELANKLRKSPPYISRVLKGDENLTIESMVKLARATNSQLKITIEQDAVKVVEVSSSMIGASPWGYSAIFSQDVKAANCVNTSVPIYTNINVGTFDDRQVA